MVVVNDYVNLTGRSPLIGPEFVDMADAYDAPISKALPWPTPGPRRIGPGERQPGVYAQLPGAPFETPARSACCVRPGGTSWGCRWPLETIATRQAGVDVLGLALVTNPAAASRRHVSTLPTSPRTGAAAVPAVAAIVRHVVGSLT